MAQRNKAADAPGAIFTVDHPTVTDQQIVEAQRIVASMPAPLPPEHVNHDVVFFNEIMIRRDGFRAGLEAIDAEIEGRRIEREEKIAEIERIFASDMNSLDKRRTMMVIAIEMSNAALEAYEAGSKGERQAEEAPDTGSPQAERDDGGDGNYR